MWRVLNGGKIREVAPLTKKVFLASELPDDARMKVIEEYRWINVDYEWWRDIIGEFTAHMEEAYGACLEHEKIEFDLSGRGWVKYRGEFWLDVHKCCDSVETLREIRSLIASAATLEPQAAKKIEGLVMESMTLHYTGGRIEISWSLYEDGLTDPFDVLASILQNERYASLPDKLEAELEGLISDEFQKLLHRLKSEFETLISDECVVETLDANGFQFTEDGDPVFGGARL